ncbi:MAG TPA: O-methyltransferase [Bacteroidales bacterium]|jgi:caffeoyl-CoA O-methyltransferase|nr:O-methyltransferase [Bacteroidales bacterium]HOS57537.1 O-methyltransferase [Bacteroidales bacterium]HPY81689.1 O-methyltransferase [Bacteroidales bacterium]HQA86983.1 O-methyltransferase [Bacteroidales bacterium]HRT14382.1 O-methyltransferase [Bacteroidales bacterium]
MCNLIDPEIVTYCEEHTTPETALLYRINRETHLRVVSPRMLSGHLQGALLSFLSTLIKPRHILEVGTYTGYATLCLAEGLPVNGTLDTIEINEELKETIERYINQSPYKNQIALHIGDALSIIPNLKKEWNLVFIDANKKDIFNFYELILPNVAKNGIILVDNVLWSGKVINETAKKDEDTEIIMKFNDFVQADQRVKNLMLPFRDGLTIIQKI